MWPGSPNSWPLLAAAPTDCCAFAANGENRAVRRNQPLASALPARHDEGRPRMDLSAVYAPDAIWRFGGKRGAWLAAILALTLAATTAGCAKKPPPPPPPTVYVATPLQRKLVDWDDYVGRFVAVNSVDVRPRVSGYLRSVG